MTLRSYLIIMSITTAVCWVILVLILNMTDPFHTNWIGFVLFYGSLFLAIMGTAAIVGFLVRFVLLKHELVFRSVKAAFRQSFLIGLLMISVLILISQDLFSWVNLFLLIFGLTLLEYFLVTYDRNRIIKGSI